MTSARTTPRSHKAPPGQVSSAAVWCVINVDATPNRLYVNRKGFVASRIKWFRGLLSPESEDDAFVVVVEVDNDVEAAFLDDFPPLLLPDLVTIVVPLCVVLAESSFSGFRRLGGAETRRIFSWDTDKERTVSDSFSRQDRERARETEQDRGNSTQNRTRGPLHPNT